MGWMHRETRVNGVRLHLVEHGEGPLVVLLHGFPEFWYSWRYQINALAEAGYRVIAPDMRGYNLSEKPKGLASYRMDALVGDVLGLIKDAGEESAVVVGHDWGGVVAWQVALRHPRFVEKLSILNAPHPVVFAKKLRTWEQFQKSLYILQFQLPIAEHVIRRDGFALLDKMLQVDPVHKEAFTAEDRRLYCEALGREGALTGGLSYYRAAARDLSSYRPREEIVEVPTQVIWGEQDKYLGLSLLEGLERWVRVLRVDRVADASHWVQCDAPAQVNALLLDFLTGR